MTPESFIKKWRSATIKERSAAQEHFIDLCRLLGESMPAGDVGLLPEKLVTRLFEGGIKAPDRVNAAYGWTDYTDAMPDEEILRRLLALNLAKAGQSLPIAKKPSQECLS